MKARKYFTQHVLAEKLDVNRKTISRWENRQIPLPLYVEPALREILREICENPKSVASFTFIGLFAGIGGIRRGFESVGGRAVFTSEWNPWAQKTYLANFGEENPIIGDIVGFPTAEIPDHDVLLAGFPCQPFSIAGVSKKNALGRPHGFACNTQGTLFFDVARIIAAKRPKAFLLENVKNLVSHDRGNTFRVILETLQNELGYDVHYRVIDGRYFVPQHRERILIAGFRKRTGFTFDDMPLPNSQPTLRTILHPENGAEDAEEPYTTGPKAKVHPKYTLTHKLWAYLRAYAEKHRLAGNGFGLAKPISMLYWRVGNSPSTSGEFLGSIL